MVNTFNQNLYNARNNKKALQNMYDAKREELATILEECRLANIELQKGIEKAYEDNAKLQKENAELLVKINGLLKRIGDTENEVDSLLYKINQLEQKINQIEKEAEQSKKEAEQSKEIIKMQKGAIDLLNVQNDNLKKREHNANICFKQLGEIQKNITTLNTKISVKHNIIKNCRLMKSVLFLNNDNLIPINTQDLIICDETIERETNEIQPLFKERYAWRKTKTYSSKQYKEVELGKLSKEEFKIRNRNFKDNVKVPFKRLESYLTNGKDGKLELRWKKVA
ncbi:MAG: hypothetical protein LBV69_04900 [Bacteroidales bacterium]|jgi:chromosome segregation ATPase|nr:hypothetical protein [Bacteroidales bacterium]